MKIAVFGTGYVGLVTGVCFSELGHHVTCIDIDSKKIDLLKTGQSPIYEPGLDELLAKNIKNERLFFTTQSQDAIEKSDVIFIAVGTPPKADGSAEMKYVKSVVTDIAEHINSYKLIITKSTVPIGTAQLIKNDLKKMLSTCHKSVEFDIASNPEFLREGCAIKDCFNPSRIIIGIENNKSLKILEELYANIKKPIIAMTPESAEMTKYAANAMLATRISLMNEFSRVCEKVGADIESIREGIGADERIGPHFLQAGIGYGGSCFPKDVSALVQIGKEVSEQLSILSAVEETNQHQRQNFIHKIEKFLPNNHNKKITVWGVAFKPETDDIREAPSLDIIQHFIDQNFTVNVYDPIAESNAKIHFKNHKNIIFCNDQYEALKDSSALIIATEWASFKNPDFSKVYELLMSPYIFDGRNIYSLENEDLEKFNYYSIGRKTLNRQQVLA